MKQLWISGEFITAEQVVLTHCHDLNNPEKFPNSVECCSDALPIGHEMDFCFGVLYYFNKYSRSEMQLITHLE